MQMNPGRRVVAVAVTAAMGIALTTTSAEAKTVASSTRIAINHSVVAVGSKAVVSGSVSPNLHNHVVYLQREIKSKWHSVLHQKLNSASRYAFTLKPGGVAKYTYRVYDPAAAHGVRSSVSRAITLTTQAKLKCTARMSNSKPTQYSTTHVLISTAASAKVTTVAHYKTTTTTHSATASSSGKADIAYQISGATHGRKVPVSVTVRKSVQTATCSTSFRTR